MFEDDGCRLPAHNIPTLGLLLRLSVGLACEKEGETCQNIHAFLR